MNLIADSQALDSYFEQEQVDAAKLRRASDWAEEVIDRFYGQGRAVNWTPTGFDKMQGKFDLRPGEVTLWAGVNGHGKTTLLSHVALNVMQQDAKVCIASMEMKPRDTMAKLTMQAAGTDEPTREFIRSFARWTDDRLWIYDHLGRLAASRALAVATYARKQLKVEHMVIDSLMKCGIGVEDLTGQKDFVDGLCAIARDTGLHIHLVVHMRKGEDEKKPPGKFDVKGAGEITDMVDNLLVVWKNLRKPEYGSGGEPDAFVRVAKQRHHSWEGGFSFWFNRECQQFREHEHGRPTYLELKLREVA